MAFPLQVTDQAVIAIHVEDFADTVCEISFSGGAPCGEQVLKQSLTN
jgi:hypothetical protein